MVLCDAFAASVAMAAAVEGGVDAEQWLKM
jgi:hypothetical protein